MAHPIIETKWQLDKTRALLNQMDTELDEAEYQLSKSEEVIESAEKWEGTKDEIESLVQQALESLSEANLGDEEGMVTRIENAESLLKDVLKELNK